MKTPKNATYDIEETGPNTPLELPKELEEAGVCPEGHEHLTRMYQEHAHSHSMQVGGPEEQAINMNNPDESLIKQVNGEKIIRLTPPKIEEHSTLGFIREIFRILNPFNLFKKTTMDVSKVLEIKEDHAN